MFEGHAYYRPTGDGQYRGMWFDNSGMFRPLDARRDGDALVSKWGTPDTEEGETTYRLHPTRMEVVDRVKAKMARGANSAAASALAQERQQNAGVSFGYNQSGLMKR